MKAYTDIEQSNKLVKILPIESADHHYVRKVTDFMGNPVDGEWSHPKYGNPNSKYAHYIVQNFENYEVIPCWSLAALLGLIPKFSLEKDVSNNAGYQLYYNYDTTYYDNPVDAAFELICWLLENEKI